METISSNLRLSPWSDNLHTCCAQASPNHHPTPQTLWHTYQLAEQWCWDRWKELEGGPPPPLHDTNPDPGGGWKLDKMPYKAATLQLHTGLPKPHSSLLTQIRTGKISLAAFLFQCQVPGVDSPACSCGWQWETAKHVILDCPRFAQK